MYIVLCLFESRLRLLNILLVFNYLYSREKQIENGYLTNI